MTAPVGLDQAAETVEINGQLVPRHYGNPTAEYAAARNGAVVIPRNHEGRVHALDRDRLDLLHRMSTNDLMGMAEGEARPTVFTTPIARIVDLVWVLNRGETALMLTGVGRATPVRRWLAGYIFYNDKVKFVDASAELGQLGVFGPQAAQVAAALLPGAGELAENRFLERDGLIVLRRRWPAKDSYTVIAPADQMPGVWDQAVAAGAEPAGEDAYQWLRLRAGQPAAGSELTEDYIPLEANLWSAVSFKKGCYIGQEIIARMESRGRLARRLMGLRLEAPVSVGAQVRVNDAAAGTVTSAGVLPDLGPVALVFLKTSAAEPGSPATVEGVAGTVAELPLGDV